MHAMRAALASVPVTNCMSAERVACWPGKLSCVCVHGAGRPPEAALPNVLGGVPTWHGASLSSRMCAPLPKIHCRHEASLLWHHVGNEGMLLLPHSMPRHVWCMCHRGSEQGVLSVADRGGG